MRGTGVGGEILNLDNSTFPTVSIFGLIRVGIAILSVSCSSLATPALSPSDVPTSAMNPVTIDVPALVQRENATNTQTPKPTVILTPTPTFVSNPAPSPAEEPTATPDIETSARLQELIADVRPKILHVRKAGDFDPAANYGTGFFVADSFY